jgi:hypothetical protein
MMKLQKSQTKKPAIIADQPPAFQALLAIAEKNQANPLLSLATPNY